MDRSALEVPGLGPRRRTVLLAGAAGLGAMSWLSACTSNPADSPGPSKGKVKAGGALTVGCTGGAASDTLDAHHYGTQPDINRIFQLYEPLGRLNEEFEFELVLAESMEPESPESEAWIITIRPDIAFHDGRNVTADDVVFSLKRILDPEDPGRGASALAYVDAAGITKVGPLTVRVPMSQPSAVFPSDVGQFYNGIVPADYDPNRPVGTGPFKYKSFTPGRQSVFDKNENYWQSGLPYLDELTIVDIPDAVALVNGLRSGQLGMIADVPTANLQSLESDPNLTVVASETGTWMGINPNSLLAPFNDVRVRQALRLIVDRDEMVAQALNGKGRVANDIYCPFDPMYNTELPQREQDLEQARFLLNQAGQSDLTLELTTAPAIQGMVETAQVFAEQAKGAGLTVKVNSVDASTLYGPKYLEWPFFMDFWPAPRTYLSQAGVSNSQNAAFPLDHWYPSNFTSLTDQARAEIDETKRKDLVWAAQELQWKEGGFVIPYFMNSYTALSSKLSGVVPSKASNTVGYALKSVGYVA